VPPRLAYLTLCRSMQLLGLIGRLLQQGCRKRRRTSRSSSPAHTSASVGCSGRKDPSSVTRDGLPLRSRVIWPAQSGGSRADRLELGPAKRCKVQAIRAPCRVRGGCHGRQKQWSDLSERIRRLFITATVAEGILKVAALIDIERRPASQIRGRKWMWAALAAVRGIAFRFPGRADKAWPGRRP